MTTNQIDLTTRVRNTFTPKECVADLTKVPGWRKSASKEITLAQLFNQRGILLYAKLTKRTDGFYVWTEAYGGLRDGTVVRVLSGMKDNLLPGRYTSMTIRKAFGADIDSWNVFTGWNGTGDRFHKVGWNIQPGQTATEPATFADISKF